MQRVEASDFHELVRVSDPRIAPGGDTVAFVRTVPEDDESYESTIYRVSVGGDEPERFTVVDGVDSDRASHRPVTGWRSSRSAAGTRVVPNCGWCLPTAARRRE